MSMNLHFLNVGNGDCTVIELPDGNLVAQLTKRPVLLLLPLGFAFLAWLSYERCKKRADDFVKSIYDLFVSGVAGTGN